MYAFNFGKYCDFPFQAKQDFDKQTFRYPTDCLDLPEKTRQILNKKYKERVEKQREFWTGKRK